MPVLLIRPTHTPAQVPRDPTFNHVLIPLDGSHLAEHIIEHARVLGSFTHAHYTVLQVIEPIMTYSSLAGGVYDERILQQMQTTGQTYLDGVAERLRASGSEVATEVVLGTPASAIIEYAEQHGVDLIAMGTHGRSGVSRLLLGSVADKVVRAACMPVLLLRPCEVPEHRTE
jgi:nucleotide-binding universal stress UspA family protein